MTVHNRRETTLRCLESLADSVYDKDRIDMDYYITDDACTDGTAEAISAAFPDAHIIKGDGSLFWNRGMHLAWEEAAKSDYDFFLWVNDDTYVFNDSLSRLLSCSASHSDEAVIVGSTTSSDGSGRITYGGWRNYKGNNNGELIAGVDKEQPCQTMNGNIVLIPRSVYLSIGKNDPYYHHSLGDLDYGLRATESGIGIFVAPGACGICDLHEKPTIWMDPSQPFSKRWDNFFRPTGNNPFEFFHFKKRHFGILPAIRSFITNILHFLFPSLWVKIKKHR